MTKTVMAFAIAAIALLVTLPAAKAATWHEWTTNRPFSGWVGFGRHAYYCDYIRYPKRVCSYDRRRAGQRCRVVGWTVRQHCSR